MVFVSERDDLASLSIVHADLYAEVERHFDHSYLSLICMAGIAKTMKWMIENNPLIPESDGENHVIHAGSIKLTLYKHGRSNREDLFGIQVMTATGPGGTGECLAAHFYYYPGSNIQAEYTIVTKYQGPLRFDVEVPGTATHDLSRVMAKLYPVMDAVFHCGIPSPRILEKVRKALSSA